MTGAAKQCRDLWCSDYADPPSDYCSVHRAGREATIDRLSAALAQPPSTDPSQWQYPPPPLRRPPRPPWWQRRGMWALAAGVLVLVIVLALVPRSHDDGGSPSGGADGVQGGADYSNDPASLLASDDGSSNVAAYSAALDRWQAKCTEDRVTVAGYADFAYRDEQKNGGDDSSRLSVMQHLTRSVPASVAPIDCSGVTAAYLVLVEG